MPMSPEIAGGVAGEMALVFCVMFSAWMAIFMLAESVAGKLSSPDAASKRELDNVLRRCPPQRSAPRREPAAMQRTRLQLLEPEDGLGFQARPRARRASGGDPGLLQHGYGSPEAEPAAVQKARAKLLEPEDGSRIPGGSAPLQESELEIQSHPKNGFEGAFGWHVPPTARPTVRLSAGSEARAGRKRGRKSALLAALHSGHGP